MENKDLVYIKKYYGEKFMHLCRTLFPTILNKEGLLKRIISTKFAPTHSLYDAVVGKQDEFYAFISSFADIEKTIMENSSNKTPEELMSDAGYILYPECETEREIQSFLPYYAYGEEICTFLGDRLDYCRVWFAIKQNVEDIKREDFTDPQRQDEYGTSVISIQFTRGVFSHLSIKNRYNHKVDNPDATFDNNLDNIIPGLTASFCKYYGVKLYDEKYNKEFTLPNFVLGDDGKYYKIISKFFDYYLCENNVLVICDKVHKFDKSKQLLVDNYLFDFENKRISPYVKDEDKYDVAFTQAIGKIKKMWVESIDKRYKKIIITPENGENIVIKINKNNQMVEYYNTNVIKCGDMFLHRSAELEKVDLPNLVKIGSSFLENSPKLVSLNVPNLTNLGDCCLYNARSLEQFIAPNLETMKAACLSQATKLKTFVAPKLKSMDSSCLSCVPLLETLNLPSICYIGNSCFVTAPNIRQFYAPNLKSVGQYFLCYNSELKEINLPNLEYLDRGFLLNNIVLEKFIAPKLTEMHIETCRFNENLKVFDVPSLKIIDNNCFENTKKLEVINAPNLMCVGCNVFSRDRKWLENTSSIMVVK